MSVEEKVEDYYKHLIDGLGQKRYEKTEPINNEIQHALENAESKSGGKGRNFPDIQMFLDYNSRRIPVMIEAKGTKNRMEKLDKNGAIEQITLYPTTTKTHQKGDKNYSAIVNYATNGAMHYALAILHNSMYKEVIFIGVNGTTIKDNKLVDPEYKAYYLSEKNNEVPKEITELKPDWELFRQRNLCKLYDILDKLTLSDNEIEALTKITEDKLESRVKAIHQAIYDDKSLKTMIGTNQKLYLFSGLIMAGLQAPGVSPLLPDELHGYDNETLNDGKAVISHIEVFLNARNANQEKINAIKSLLQPTFDVPGLWKPVNGISPIHRIYSQIYTEILPLLKSNLRLDFTGKILNSLNDWVSIENDRANDVVLTPRYVTRLMAKMAHTDMDSYVWDTAMGSGGFLVSAMDLMLRDAQKRIQDKVKLAEKIKHIKSQQLLGIEILGNIWLLSILNMTLMGDGSSNLRQDNSHLVYNKVNFPANAFLLNPPYSAPGKGLDFVEEALSQMQRGYACVLIQENAGSGNGQPFAKNILKNNTLEASIHMPVDLFGGKSSVQTAIYVFKVNQPHNPKSAVKFIDFSIDGYTRQNRKKSSQDVNLRDTDHAKERYQEVLDLVLGNVPDTEYYTKDNGKYIEDKISLDGNDWTWGQHRRVSLKPNEKTFKDVVSEYLAFKVSQVLKGDSND